MSDMVTTITMIGVMVLIFAIPVGLLISLGVVIYKDAKAHNMSAGLWTAVAVLAPNLIGVIIYLVVRSNQEKKFNCSNCQAEVKADYNICPSCQAVFENTCEACKHAISTQMDYCPYCGTQVEEKIAHQTATKITKKTNIVKPLAIIGGIYVGIIALLFAFVIIMGVTGSDTFESTSVSVMSIETSMGNHLKAKFQYNQGNDSISVKKVAGETIQITGDMNVEKGQITMTVENPQGEVVYTQTYSEPVQGIDESIPAAIEGKYKVKLKIDGAKGSYDLRAN